MKNVQVAIDATSQNIANINTTGFKKSEVSFESVLGRSSDDLTSPAYSGTAVNSISRDFSQGFLKRTDIATDLALTGQGFFTLQSASGAVVYSRSGNFKFDQDLNLVDANGNFVLSTGASQITLPADSNEFTISPLGELFSRTDSNSEFTLIGQLQLANFSNPGGLESLDGGAFAESSNSGPATFSAAGGAATSTAETFIVSGTLEGSNVELSQAFTNLTAFQRSFQAAARAASIADEVINVTLALSS